MYDVCVFLRRVAGGDISLLCAAVFLPQQLVSTAEGRGLARKSSSLETEILEPGVVSWPVHRACVWSVTVSDLSMCAHGSICLRAKYTRAYVCQRCTGVCTGHWKVHLGAQRRHGTCVCWICVRVRRACVFVH